MALSVFAMCLAGLLHLHCFSHVHLCSSFIGHVVVPLYFATSSHSFASSSFFCFVPVYWFSISVRLVLYLLLYLVPSSFMFPRSSLSLYLLPRLKVWFCGCSLWWRGCVHVLCFFPIYPFFGCLVFDYMVFCSCLTFLFFFSGCSPLFFSFFCCMLVFMFCCSFLYAFISSI